MIIRVTTKHAVFDVKYNGNDLESAKWVICRVVKKWSEETHPWGTILDYLLCEDYFEELKTVPDHFVHL
jgi:hypothetical protein